MIERFIDDGTVPLWAMPNVHAIRIALAANANVLTDYEIYRGWRLARKEYVGNWCCSEAEADGLILADFRLFIAHREADIPTAEYQWGMMLSRKTLPPATGVAYKPEGKF